eukprot:5343644-Pleurochrysis_carterae.AAC.1
MARQAPARAAHRRPLRFHPDSSSHTRALTLSHAASVPSESGRLPRRAAHLTGCRLFSSASPAQPTSASCCTLASDFQAIA